jgi:protein O-mannosyl-transferase
VSWRRLASPPALAVALLALLASATSLANGFVYDDGPIVEANPRVHTLARFWQIFAQPYWPPGWGDANYRPLTIFSFALQWAVGNGSPAVFHAANVLLYVATCVAVFALARLVLPEAAAWLAAALFAVHPVHVEAVGNVVGQPELVVALCSTLAVAAYVRARKAATGQFAASRRTAAAIGGAYVVACLSKETGFFLPGLLLAAELTIVGAYLPVARRPLLNRLRETWPSYATCAAIAGAYLGVRHAVLGGLGDDPNSVVALLGHKARLLTMLGVVPEWARLLLWPARLAADYSPPAIRIHGGFAWALVPAAGILVACVLVCLADSRRRVATFGIAWLAVALFPVNNLYVRSGVILAERTLFLPSVGVVLAVGVGATLAAARWGSGRLRLRRPMVAVPLALVLATGIAASVRRQRVWRSNDDFYRSIVDDAPLGYRAHYMHGMWLFEKGRRAEGERHVRTAIALFPYDAEPYTDLANEYRKTGLCAPARQLYRRALAVGSQRAEPRLGLIVCLLHDGELAEAGAEARRGIERGGVAVPEFRRLLAVADSAAGVQSDPVTLSGVPRTGPNPNDSRP